MTDSKLTPKQQEYLNDLNATKRAEFWQKVFLEVIGPCVEKTDWLGEPYNGDLKLFKERVDLAADLADLSLHEAEDAGMI